MQVPLLRRHVVVAELAFLIRKERATPSYRIEDQEGIAWLALLVSELHLPRDTTELGADEGRFPMPSRSWIVRGARYIVIYE
ncbi:MAG: hypothetical protein ACK53L_11710, partial [Pirellulaceae bacterium]